MFNKFKSKTKSLVVALLRRSFKICHFLIQKSPPWLVDPFLLKQTPIWNNRNKDVCLKLQRNEEIVQINAAPFWGKNYLEINSVCRVPEQWHAILNDASIHSPPFAVTTKNTVWQQEEVAELPFTATGYSNYILRKGNGYFLPSQFMFAKKLPEAALLAHRTSFNYFHSIFETLPKIHCLNEIDPDKKIPVILSSNISSNLKAIIEHLLQGREVIYQSFVERLKVEKLHLFSTPSFLPDDKKFDIKNATISRIYPTIIRDMLKSSTEPEQSPIELLWISRKKYVNEHSNAQVSIRDISNNEALENIMSQRGIVTFYPEQHSWQEQRNIFNRAKRIIMVSGSAVSNLVFCKPDTRVLFLCKNEGVNPGLFFPICEELDIKHGWVLGRGDPHNPHARFTINETDFEAGLEWLCNNSGVYDGLFPV